MKKKGIIANSIEREKLKREQKRKRKKVIAAILATVGGVGSSTVASFIVAYEVMFAHCDRPDYSITPGEYCYERVKDRLFREEFYFNAGDSRLKGYYYPSTENKGLVIVVPGLRAGADDFIPISEYLVNSGYNVFSYDGTGVYDSEGDSMVGMCQALIDLEQVVNYLNSEEKYKSQPKFLIGHSLGGYAVTSVLAIHKDIKAVVGIAPMCSASSIMVDKGTQYAGKVAYLSKPLFDSYQWILFEKYLSHNGVRGINSVDIPVLIAQGIDDKDITYDKQSIIAHRNKITNPNVIYYETKGVQGGHQTIMHSVESVLYQKEVESDLKRLKFLKGADLTKEEKADYIKTVNHKLYSAVNEELMQKILEMFNSVL